MRVVEVAQPVLERRAPRDSQGVCARQDYHFLSGETAPPKRGNELRSVEVRLTKKTASLAAMATISAQETTPGHCLSSSSLASSITSYPLKLKLAGESFSAVLSLVESINTDASHPCTTIENLH
nr:Os03g0369250 [Ipomoea trifida]